MTRVVLLGLVLLLAGCGQPGAPAPQPLPIQEPPQASVPDLIKQLKDPDHEVRRKAARTLGERGAEAESAIPALDEMMFTDPDLITRDFAADALRGIGPKAALVVPKLLLALKSDNDNVRNSAITQLGRLGMEPDTVVPALVEALGEGPPSCNYATIALANFGPAAKAALPELQKALQSPSAHMRIAAAEAVWKISQQSKDALPVLVAALKDVAPPPPPRGGIAQLDDGILLRWKAARVLADMGPAAKEAVPALLTALGDRSPDVRADAALALWKVDRQAEPAVKTLIEVLETQDSSSSPFPLSAAHTTAAEHLGEIGSPARSALPALKRVSADVSQPRQVRQAAAKAVEKIETR